MKQKKEALPVIDINSLSEINVIEVKVNDSALPLKIGDKLQFPVENPMLKTIAAIQINESGQASYLLEWFEDGEFKQYWLSLTELKLLKDAVQPRNTISFS